MESANVPINPSKEERFIVEAQISKNPETGEPLFNGLSRSKIIGYPFYRNI